MEIKREQGCSYLGGTAEFRHEIIAGTHTQKFGDKAMKAVLRGKATVCPYIVIAPITSLCTGRWPAISTRDPIIVRHRLTGRYISVAMIAQPQL